MKLEAAEKRFSGVVAVGGVDLELSKGEIRGLIGPNGSGKTTLLGLASGVLKPTGGRILVDGLDLTGKRPADFARAGIGRTFQQVRLFAGLTAAETVEVGAVAKGLPVDGALEALAAIGLADYAGREATTLSYGLQRRVEIARALAGQPDLLLLDEPAAGMNEEESEELLLTIRQLVGSIGCGVLIVEHDLRLIMRLCQRVQVLSEGTTLAEGTPAEIQSDPRVIETYIGNAYLEKNGREQ